MSEEKVKYLDNHDIQRIVDKLRYQPEIHVAQLEVRIRELEADKTAYMKDVDDMAKERNYWEARATTAEEKVKEWSVRACEADEHIAKAREILEKAADSADYLHRSTLLRALDALEGK